MFYRPSVAMSWNRSVRKHWSPGISHLNAFLPRDLRAALASPTRPACDAENRGLLSSTAQSVLDSTAFLVSLQMSVSSARPRATKPPPFWNTTHRRADPGPGRSLPPFSDRLLTQRAARLLTCSHPICSSPLPATLHGEDAQLRGPGGGPATNASSLHLTWFISLCSRQAVITPKLQTSSDHPDTPNTSTPSFPPEGNHPSPSP